MKKITRLFTLLLFCCTTKLFAQTFEWVYTIGDTAQQEVRSVCFDTAGNVYSTGYYIGVPSFGTSTAPATGTGNCFIQKTDPSGNLLWVKFIESRGGCWGNAIKTDTSGNIYVTGAFNDTTDFDPSTGVYSLYGFLDPGGALATSFVLKLDSSGNLVWVKAIGNTYGVHAMDLDVDVTQNIYLTGAFNDTVDFDPGPGTYDLIGQGTFNYFILKLNSSGNFAWANGFGATGYNMLSHSIFVDGNNDIVTTGTFEGTIDFDPSGTSDIKTSNGQGDVFVQKFSSAGNHVWVQTVGNTGYDESFGISTDNSNNIYVTGYYSGYVDFDPGAGTTSLFAAGQADMFVLKLNAAGNFVWAKSAGGTYNEYGKAITTDQYGYVYTTGYIESATDFDPNAGTFIITPNVWDDVFVWKMDTNGNLVWAKNIESTGMDQGLSIAVNQDQDIAIGGTLQSPTIDFDIGSGTYNYTCQGASDGFVTKWSQDICSNFTLVFDSVADLTCTHAAIVSSYGTGGSAPYSYVWNTSPVVNDSILHPTAGGIYQLTITDSIGCSRSSAVLVNAPGNPSAFDLQANMSTFGLRPGMISTFLLYALNDGCVPASGNLMLVMDTLFSFSSAMPAPDLISGDTLIWNFSNIVYGSTPLMPIAFLQCDSSAALGTTACFDLIITPIGGDVDTTNNIRHFCGIINNSFDPNTKEVFPEGICNEGYVENDQLLSYTINFQNTGNAEAINIAVIDSLDSDLDITTLRVVGSSDTVITEVLPGNVLKFHFNNILLPDSTTNEPESHGFVAYEIMPTAGLANGVEINNKASIYFDINPAIVTNTVMNTIIDTLPNTTGAGISQSGNLLTANESGLNYQWINCSTNQPIPGATSQTYTATSNGSYAVIISNGGCSTTSECLTVSTVNISEYETTNIVVYPNPTKSTFTIDLGNAVEDVRIEIFDVLGNVLYTETTKGIRSKTLDIKGAAGIYFVAIKTGKTKKYVKIIKE